MTEVSHAVIRGLRAALAALAGFALLAACDAPRPELAPLPKADLAAYETSVRTGLVAAHEKFDKVAASKPSNETLGAAYGELAMMYHAQDIIAPAQVAYANAHALAPRDARWPYLLAQLHADASRVPEAIKWFQVVLKIDPKHAAALVALGQAYFQTGDFANAKTMYERAKADPDARAAAAAGLGKVALAQQHYPAAITELEEALKLAPGATRLYQALAAAHRGAGDAAKAEQALARYDIGGTDPGTPDAAADALADRVLASKVLLRRGQRAGKAGRFDLAAEAFRAAYSADPQSAEALANFGIALANLGRTQEAQKHLEQALAMDDSNTVALLSLGVVYDRQGMDQAAILQYERTLRKDPENQQARVYLADAKMRTNAARQAIDHYRAALARAPESPRMHLSLAMAQVKAGDFRAARGTLERAASEHAGDRDIVNALARVLITAPDKAVRSDKSGFEMAKTLFEKTRSPEVGQTYAMGFAASGNFDEAVKLQQETMIAYERARLPVDKAFLEENLARYRAHKAANAGWGPDDFRLNPRSPATQLQSAAAAPRTGS